MQLKFKCQNFAILIKHVLCCINSHKEFSIIIFEVSSTSIYHSPERLALQDFIVVFLTPLVSESAWFLRANAPGILHCNNHHYMYYLSHLNMDNGEVLTDLPASHKLPFYSSSPSSWWVLQEGFKTLYAFVKLECALNLYKLTYLAMYFIFLCILKIVFIIRLCSLD